MDEIELLRRYGKRAALTERIDVDVTTRVMQTLRSRREERPC